MMTEGARRVAVPHLGRGMAPRPAAAAGRGTYLARDLQEGIYEMYNEPRRERFLNVRILSYPDVRLSVSTVWGCCLPFRSQQLRGKVGCPCLTPASGLLLRSVYLTRTK